MSTATIKNRKKISHLRILRIHPFYPSITYKVKRGTMRHEQDRRLTERGHKIYVVSCKTFGAPVFEKVGGIQVFRVPAITLPILEYPFPNLLMLYLWILRIAKTKKVNVIHFTDTGYLTSLPIFLTRAKLKKPIVLTVIGFPGVSWFYGYALVDLVGKIYTYTVGKKVLAAADKVILSATSMIKDAVRFGVPVSRVKVILRGVDTHLFHPDTEQRRSLRKRLALKEDDIVVLFAGRLVPVKGISYFMEAARMLLEKSKDSLSRKLKFLVAGDGVLRGKYEKNKFQHSSNIRFLGFRHDMSNVMNAADIFVLSSISEGCPNAVLEAAACAKPVIATDVGAVRDIIIDGATGLIVRPRDVNDLYNAVNKVTTKLDRMSMGKKAMELVTKRFTWDMIASKYEKMYLETLELQKADGSSYIKYKVQ